MQELESLLENLNKVVPQSQDEEHQRVAREYASLNESLFQCLESHRYWKFNEDFGPKLLCCSKSIRRNLLQMNTVVDQHNLILMWEIMNLVAPLLSLNYCRPYTALNNKLKHKTSKERISPSSWTSVIISDVWVFMIGQGLFMILTFHFSHCSRPNNNGCNLIKNFYTKVFPSTHIKTRKWYIV